MPGILKCSLPAIVSALFLLSLSPSQSIAREALTDHPLISPYEGATLRRKKVLEFDEYHAFAGMDDTGKEAITIDLEGRITKMNYVNPTDRSRLEMIRNYEAAVLSAGAEILYQCNQDELECVERYAGPTFQKTSDINAMANLAGRYLLARINQGAEVAYVAIAVGQSSTDIHVIEVKAMQMGMVHLDADALGKGLDRQGYVVVEGIYFDTDKATLKPESMPALTEVAGLLGERPALEVFVVGHTDLQGSLAHNQALSEARARAVLEALAAEFGIARDRMESHGVGPRAPKATNANEAGRSLNRRVVLVSR